MRKALLVVGLVTGWMGILPAPTGWCEPAADGSVAEVAEHLEAALAAPVLLDENERLQERVAQLDAQVAELMVLLAEARATLDRLQVADERLTDVAGSPGSDGVSVADRLIQAVNRELELVVIDGGADSGLRTGLVLAVVRGERVVARVRVVEVRNKISGARIETVLGDEYPQQGDRLVVWRSSME